MLWDTCKPWRRSTSMVVDTFFLWDQKSNQGRLAVWYLSRKQGGKTPSCNYEDAGSGNTLSCSKFVVWVEIPEIGIVHRYYGIHVPSWLQIVRSISIFYVCILVAWFSISLEDRYVYSEVLTLEHVTPWRRVFTRGLAHFLQVLIGM